jgi:hypothetical protein
MDATPVTVRALGNAIYAGGQVGYELWEGEELSMPEPVAIHASVPNAKRDTRELRHGKALVEIISPLSERGKRYRENVTAFVAANPAWDTQLPGFPWYHDTFAT